MTQRLDRAWSVAEGALASDRAFALAVLGVLGVALGFWLHTHEVLAWSALFSGDAHEFAVVARRLYQGEGFTTPVIFPAELPIFGAGADHPSVLRPPLWPLVEAGFFLVAGPRAEAIHAALLLCFLGTVGAGMALSAAVAGRLSAVAAGLAIGTCEPFLMFSIDGLSEPLFAVLATGALLLFARGAHPALLGALCGLAYLTRANGAALLPAFLALLWFAPDRWRRISFCTAGFVAVAAPWWIRNLMVAGDPFYSLYSWVIYYAPNVRTQSTQILFQLDPGRRLDAGYPLRKFGELLPGLLLAPPYLAENAVAAVGVGLACLRRERASLVFALLAVATLLIVAIALPSGRYFTPLFPAMLALGAAAWARYGGRLRVPAAALLLALPFAPAPLPELGDIGMMRDTMAAVRAGLGFDRTPEEAEAETRALARCLADRPLVLAHAASRVAWQTDAIAIHLPSSGEDFWRIVDEYPVRFLRLRRYRRASMQDVLERFEPRPDCGGGVFERRGPLADSDAGL